MRKIIKNYFSLFTLTFALILSGSINAQPPRGGGQQGPPPVPNEKQIKKMVTELAEEISLSSEQQTKVQALYTEHFKTIKEKTSGNARPERSEMETLEKKHENKVKALLSKEQQTKYTAYLKKQAKQRPPR